MHYNTTPSYSLYVYISIKNYYFSFSQSIIVGMVIIGLDYLNSYKIIQTQHNLFEFDLSYIQQTRFGTLD